MANQAVLTGFWIDHSQGPVLGATVTLNANWGSQLISAAAIIVQIIGVYLWAIIALGTHQWRASPHRRDEPHQQLQVLLRNTGGPDWAAWNLGSLVKKWWQDKRPGPYKTAAIFEVTALVVWAGFIVAGIFVGQITLNQFGNSIVLLKQGACGYITDTDSQDSATGFNHVAINVSQASLQYARSCYGPEQSTGAISCSVYPVPSLTYTMSTNGSCPIPDDSACLDTIEGGPVTFTTTPLDSHFQLGINARPRDRMTFQYQTTCAPLAYGFVDNFTKTDNITSGQNTILTERFYAGSLVQKTFSQPYLYAYAPIIRDWGVNVIGYSVNAYQSLYPHLGFPEGWTPAAPFNETKLDLSLFFVATNGITFTGPVQDPMFRTYSEPTAGIGGPATYVPLRDVYVMACGEEWQICNPANDACTGWDNTFGLAANYTRWYNELSLTSQQNATMWRMMAQLSDSTMFSAVNGIGAPLLASTYLVTPTGSQPLPNGHWRSEVEGWFQAVLAKAQFLQTVYARTPESVVKANHIEIIPPDTEAGLQQCGYQRVTSPEGYQSYSFFGLVFVAFMGLLIPGIAYALRVGHHYIPGWDKESYRYRSYEDEDMWRLHEKVMKHEPKEADDDDMENKSGHTGRQRSGSPDIQSYSNGTNKAYQAIPNNSL